MFSPHGNMLFGAFISLAAVFMGLAMPMGSLAVLAVCGGAVFGKGYGVWEERNRAAKVAAPVEGGE